MQLLLLRAPDRRELGERPATLAFSPVRLAPGDFAPLRLAGAWALSSDDPRFGGVSALVIERGQFIALTDSGVLIRFVRPAGSRSVARIAELPDGPGEPSFKYNRDSEALLRDPLGRGWWVGFENRNQAWLYDPAFTRALGRIAFGPHHWPKNKGIEGLAADGKDVLLFPEAGDTVVRWDGQRARTMNLRQPRGRISDAARLPDGVLVVLHRHLTLHGFANALTLLKPATAGGWTTAQSFTLRGTGLDNFEALAAESRPNGETRLWLMTDDNFQRPLRTLLIALDVPEDFGG